ncbi:TetR/AcrR family transcriptional regulator C-terminal domain-containing protein [Streptomyces sp. NPDC051452]|uniref:TetR/AcrR family transcriptional regulator C-terminal domain-containing protein n=1 Tax=Streptomyces sp. NPDC051452 TaxID=3365654 RepID=UPI00379E5720
MHLTVTHHVVGAVLLDAGGAVRTPGERTAVTGLFASLPPGAHPLVTTHSALLGAVDADEEFAFGLRCLLDGIAETRKAR